MSIGHQHFLSLSRVQKRFVYNFHNCTSEDETRLGVETRRDLESRHLKLKTDVVLAIMLCKIYLSLYLSINQPFYLSLYPFPAFLNNTFNLASQCMFFDSRLPIPWFLWSAINSFNPLRVDSHGLFCSTLSLFIMLIAVIASIAIFKWKMSKKLAMAMFALYTIFLTLALLIEFKVFVCFF